MEGEDSFRQSLRGFSSSTAGGFTAGLADVGNFFRGAGETTQESLQGLLSGASSSLQNAGITTRREDNDAGGTLGSFPSIAFG